MQVSVTTPIPRGGLGIRENGLAEWGWLSGARPPDRSGCLGLGPVAKLWL